MSIPDHFPRRLSRAVPVKAAPPDSIAAESVPGAPAAPGSWPWRRAAPLALVAAFAPAPAARPAAPLAVVVLLAGMIGQVTHTAVFFLPALAAMTGAAVQLWRERG